MDDSSISSSSSSFTSKSSYIVPSTSSSLSSDVEPVSWWIYENSLETDLPCAQCTTVFHCLSSPTPPSSTPPSSTPPSSTPPSSTPSSSPPYHSSYHLVKLNPPPHLKPPSDLKSTLNPPPHLKSPLNLPPHLKPPLNTKPHLKLLQRRHRTHKKAKFLKDLRKARTKFRGQELSNVSEHHTNIISSIPFPKHLSYIIDIYVRVY